jgi:hypothetical protein
VWKKPVFFPFSFVQPPYWSYCAEADAAKSPDTRRQSRILNMGGLRKNRVNFRKKPTPRKRFLNRCVLHDGNEKPGGPCRKLQVSLRMEIIYRLAGRIKR